MTNSQLEKALEREVKIADGMVKEFDEQTRGGGADEHREPITTGYCYYCTSEDHIGLDVVYSQDEADRIVTAKCECEEAAQDRRKRSTQERYDEMVKGIHAKREYDENTRNDIAQGALDTLDQLFGSGAVLYGKIKIDDEVLGFLHNAAMLVYDGLIGSFSTAVAASVSVKITIKKGVLAIERAEAIKQKMEVV